MPTPATQNSDASSSRSGILVSTTDNPSSRTETDNVPPSDSAERKRKRDAPPLAMEDLLKSTIVVKPHPCDGGLKSRTLHPLMLLPREHLPLSSLDLSLPHGDFSASRFYESKIKILDLEGRLGSNLLLARADRSRNVYAIERQNGGLFVLCKLGSWVDILKLAQSATVTCSQRLRTYAPVPVPGGGELPLTTPQLHHENKKRRLAIEEIQSMVKRRPRSQSIATTLSQDPTHGLAPIETCVPPPAVESQNPPDLVSTISPPPESQSNTVAALPEAVDDAQSQPTAEDIFQNIRTQYLEALYHSRGSLAYFAKGPLSRARATFHLDCDSNLEMNDLVDFLKSLVMTTVLIDKKYRETVPEIISKLKIQVEDSDNDEPKPKKRKVKKPKIGKDGLYPLEESHVQRWWKANKPNPSNVRDQSSVTPEEVKYHISCLRRRETQLQMILILEILALEPLTRPAEGVDDTQLPGMESQPPPGTGEAAAAAKKRNKHNFPVLLDVNADRLCIWQSTTLDEVRALAESQAPNRGQQAEGSDRNTSDPLKDFCVDVILPFFSARLPDLCDSICRKLGGPVIKSPGHAKQSKPTTKPKAKPGAPAKKPTASRKERERTLERVLSNEQIRRSVSRGPSSALTLMRSASATTIPGVPGLKREASESLLGMVPRKKQAVPVKERPANLFTRRSSQSSIDGDKASKKKALVEAELKDAISALKRPNRALAGREIVEAAEKRATTSLSQLKKAKKPTRVSSVQVKATPANNRFKDVMATSRGGGLALPEVIRDDMDAAPSSSSVVPSSTAPKRTIVDLLNSPAIAMTPIAGSKSHASSGRLQFHGHDDGSPAIPPSSPIMTRKAAGPARNTSQGQYLSVPGSGVAARVAASPCHGRTSLFETPPKPRSSGTSHHHTVEIDETPVKPLRLPGGGRRGSSAAEPPAPLDAESGTGGGAKQLTIYQQLGWDDDYDDL